MYLSELAGIIELENMTDLDQKLHNNAPPTHRELVQENAHLKAENQFLKEQLGLAKHRLFAPKSEASPTGQEAMLFNEAEAIAAPEAPDPVSETITYTRRKVA